MRLAVEPLRLLVIGPNASAATARDLRRVTVEAAWAYRHRPNPASGQLRARQQGQPASVIALATKAQQRLCPRYRRLMEQGKPPLAVATTIARELLGFIWAMGHAVEPSPTLVGARMSA